MIDKLRADALLGTSSRVADRLNEPALRLQLQEIVINAWTHGPEARRHCYALLARAFGLRGAAPAP